MLRNSYVSDHPHYSKLYNSFSSLMAAVSSFSPLRLNCSSFLETRNCIDFSKRSKDLKKNKPNDNNIKRDSIYVDESGNFRKFNHKKVSRKRGGSMRGRGWKYGSGFVDGIFPVLSPIAQQILNYLQKEMDVEKAWASLDTLPPTNHSWDDLVNVSVQLRLNKQWNPIITVCEWILQKSPFKPDVLCYNLLIDSYGQKGLSKKAETIYFGLLEASCVPTEDTYALLLTAYSICGQLEKAEAVFSEMQNNGIFPSTIVYNAYIKSLLKRRQDSHKAIEVFQRMKRNGCEPSSETYTSMISLYGKERRPEMALKIFNEMISQKCLPNICTYTALINAFARNGLCEKAEEIFEELQELGLEPDVYTYNALMEGYSRAGFPNGAAEIFSVMKHMDCEPDKASYNIMMDAYGRAGLHEDAQGVFEEMKRLGIKPTMKSHMLLLSAYSKSGNLAKCENILGEMQKMGIKPDTYVINSMMNLYGRLGDFDKMESTFAAMENEGGGGGGGRGYAEADISTYNILMNVYGRAGFIEKMEEQFGLIREKKNMKPDVITWTCRIGAYSKKKQYKKCLEIFEEMIDEGCYPDGGTAKVLLSSCSSQDQIEQVTTVIRNMHKAKGIYENVIINVSR